MFGKFLMNTTAFLSLEDIADNLPPYDESVVSVEMDSDLAKAYEELEDEIRSAMREHRGNKSLMSILLSTLLCTRIIPMDLMRSGRGPSIQRRGSTSSSWRRRP